MAITESTVHRIQVQAPVDVVYRILADVGRWPEVFGPTVLVERLGGDAATERLRMWAYTSGVARTWISVRRLFADEHRIEFGRERSMPPVRSMAGVWRLTPHADGTLVALEHSFSADDASGIDWIRTAVERNSTAELAALERAARLGPLWDELSFTFADELDIDGPIEQVYDFLYQAADWADRIPHVARIEVTEDPVGLQVMEMDTRSTDGSTHTTKSVRICRGPGQILYKQTATPAVMTAHTGEWRLHQVGPRVRAVSRHTVVLDVEGVGRRFGDGVPLETARNKVRASLSANSLNTLRLAKTHAERGR